MKNSQLVEKMLKKIKLGKSLNPSMKAVLKYLELDEGDFVIISENDRKIKILKVDEEVKGKDFIKKLKVGKNRDITISNLLKGMGAEQGDFMIVECSENSCEISISKELEEEYQFKKKLGKSLDISISSLLEKIGVNEGDFVYIGDYYLSSLNDRPCGITIRKIDKNSSIGVGNANRVKKIGARKQINLSNFFKNLFASPDDEIKIEVSDNVITIYLVDLYNEFLVENEDFEIEGRD